MNDKKMTMETAMMIGPYVLMNVERERIPSQLRGSVDVFVTSEDIMMYIIIVCYCTPIEDVFASFQDVIIVYGT